MEIEEVKKEIAAIVKSELPPTGFSSFFFGSRVTGTATETSDIDVGIEGLSAVPEKMLRSIKDRCGAIRTLYSIDIVDFSMLSEDFQRVAKSAVEPIL